LVYGALPRPNPIRLQVEPRNLRLLPPRSMVGQLPLEQPIGVRIPGGQPIQYFPLYLPPPYSTYLDFLQRIIIHKINTLQNSAVPTPLE
jgi:hypothetical protein